MRPARVSPRRFRARRSDQCRRRSHVNPLSLSVCLGPLRLQAHINVSMNAIGTGSIKDYASHLRSHFENALLDQTRSPHANAGLALIIFASALAARFALDMFVPDRAPYITFFPAVLLSAVFCGLWPTIAVAAASGISGTFWLHAPEGSSLNYRLAGMLVFAFSAALSLFLAESLRNALAGLRERDRHLQLLNDELSHRMRNLFQLANAIVSQSLRD